MNIKNLFLLLALAPIFVIKGIDLELGRTRLEILEEKCRSFCLYPPSHFKVDNVPAFHDE